MHPLRIFISSVQREFAKERAELRDYVRSDPLLRQFFEVFLFEDVPASDRRPDKLYLEEVERSDVYVGLLGSEYGTEDDKGVSPTEREFDHAAALSKHRLIFVKGVGDGARNPKMQALIDEAQASVIRKRFNTLSELVTGLYAALVEYLTATEVIRSTPFDAAPCMRATVDDLNSEFMVRFIRTARRARQFPLTEDASSEELLEHLNLLHDQRPTNAAVLLFGKTPQRFLISSEIRCAHFHGTVVSKPIPSYQVYKGTAFDLVDQAVDFVLSKINRSIGTRAETPRAPTTYEIPKEVVTEAIVNAVAHRDYTNNGSVQVMLFADRLEVRNPGSLPPSLTLAELRVSHGSVPGNPLLAESMYLAEYIERMGTGTLDMIRRCVEAGLPEPEFAVTDGFVATVRRPLSQVCTISAYCGREPLPEVQILALFPNNTWISSRTNKHGEAHLRLHSLHLPMTVFAAVAGYAACTEYGWIPGERTLSLQFDSLKNGGSVIFPKATGFIPGLKGRLNLERDLFDQIFLYASNVAVDEGQSQPASVDFGEMLRLTDADNNEVMARVVDIVGRAVLLEYRVLRIQLELQLESQPESQPESRPESRPESLETRVLRLLAAEPMSKTELSMNLGQKKISGQLNKVVRSLVDKEKIAFTRPETPRSRFQKYQLTNKGQAAVVSLNAKR